MKSSSQIRLTLYLVLLISLIPATALILWSGTNMRQDTLSMMRLDGDIKLRLLAIQQYSALDLAHTQLLRLSQSEEARGLNSAALRDLFDEIVLRSEIYDNIYIADAGGDVLAAAVDFKSGVNIKDSPLFRAAAASAGFACGAGVRDPFTGASVLPFARAVPDDKGNILAVIVSSINRIVSPDYVENLIQGKATRVVVLDREGKIAFAHPYGSAQAGDDYAEWSLLADLADEQGFFTSAADTRDERVNAFRRLRFVYDDSGKPLLTLHISQPSKIAYAEANSIFYRNLALMGTAILAAISIIWALGHTTAFKSTRRLLNVAGRISAGELEARSTTAGLTGDFAHLAASLDSMAEALEKRKEDLIKAKNTALAANISKSEFLTSMSHGIRTPMNSIIGMTYLILKMDLTPKQKSYMNTIYSASNNLMGIINDILDFSKIEAGQFSMEESPFSIDELMDSVSAMVCQKAAEKGLSIRLSVEQDVPSRLVGDSLRLGQVLINLAGNAVKFTAKGTVAIHCRLLEKCAGKAKLAFTVRDTGIGMTEEQIGRLFQAFTQADGSTTRKFGGTGLGLTISKRLIELMQGDIHIQSQPGGGTTVEASLWIKAQEEDARASSELAATLAGLPVLLVDDDRESAPLFARRLREIGLKVDCAATPEEGFHMLGAQGQGAPYRLVCLELCMEKMDGPRMAAYIRDNLYPGNPPRTLVATCTAYSPEAQARCDDSGALGIMRKLTTRRTLLEALDDIFQGRSVGARPAPEGQEQLPQINQLRDLRILLVEDNPVNQQVAVELLQDTGAVVKVAGNGVNALKMARAAIRTGAPFDMMLLDMQMPKMDGYEVARHIRADERFNSMPIIAMTAHVMAEERQKCLDYGMNDHLSKPLEVKKFYETLLRWARRGKEREERAKSPATGAPVKKSATAAKGASGLCPSRPGGSAGEQPPVVIPDGLPELPGLNKAALTRLGGNTALYKKLLIRFVEFYKDMADEYRKAVQSGESESAVRMAHTLKGLAGSIGADDLSEAARLLEYALRQDQPEAATLADKCFGLLAEVQAMLGEALRLVAEPAPAGPAEESSPPGADGAGGFAAGAAEARRLRARLLDYLRDDDSAATAFFEEHRSVLSTLLPPQKTAALEQALARFEFDEALEIMEADKQNGRENDASGML